MVRKNRRSARLCFVTEEDPTAHPQINLHRLPKVIWFSVIPSLALLGTALPAVGQNTRLPVLLSFALQDSAGTIARTELRLRLSHSAAGMKPNEFRVSARGDFLGAAWQPYERDFRLGGWSAYLSGGSRCSNGVAGVRLVLFLQLRAELGGAVQIVNGQRTVVAQKIESNVLSDEICVLD